jgi:MFS family permease
MMLFLAPAVFLSTMPVPATGTAIQLIVPSLARGQVSALYIMWSTLVGIILGPVLVGLLNDLHLPIRYSMAIVVALPVPLMFWLYMRARAPYRELRAV